MEGGPRHNFMRVAIVLLFLAAPAVADTSGRPEAPKHPWLSFKPGSWVKYKYVTTNGGIDTAMDYTITLLEASKEKIKLEYLTGVNGQMNKHVAEMKPGDDPYKAYEKVESGKETITVAGRRYACTVTTYKMNQNQGQGLDYTMKIWNSPYVVGGMVRMEGKYAAQGVNMTWTMEVAEFLKK